MPRLIFTSDMSDALSVGEYTVASNLEPYERADGKRRYRPRAGAVREGGVPFEFLEAEVVDVAASENGSRHIWQWLTKLPGRAAEFSSWLARERKKSWPANLWIGTSVTSNESLGRVRSLLKVGDERTVRFLSVEPLWEAVSLENWLGLGQVTWVIVGGESKQGRTPVHEFRVEWVRTLREECASRHVPIFVKQLGSHVTEGGARLRFSDSHGGEWDEWPLELRVRELPRVR
jgi:protein gp37